MSFLRMLATALVVVLLYPAVAGAEEGSGPLFVQVRTTTVKPGQNGTYEGFIQRLNAARAKAAWPLSTLVAQHRTGENRYLNVTLYDRYSDLQKSVRSLFDDREWGDLMEMVEESVAGGQVQTFFSRPDLGRQVPLTPAEADGFIIIMVRVKQGMGPAYEEALQKLVEATGKVAPELGWIAYSPDLSSANTYRFVIPQTWEGIDTPGLSIPERYVKAFGEEEGLQWLNRLNEPIDSVDTFMTVNRSDLSYAVVD